MESTCHKGVIFHGVAEHHQLGAAQTRPLTGQVGGVLDDAPHTGHGVHIDTRPGGTHIHTGADKIRFRQCLGDGTQQQLIAPGEAFLHRRGKAADEVHTAGLSRPIHGQGKGHKVLCSTAGGNQSHGGDGNAFVDNRDAELAFNILAGFYQIFSVTGDLVINLVAAALRILADAVQQGDAHGDGADVQMVLVDHIDGVENTA